MKKILFIICLSLFILPSSVFALSYTANDGNTYEVIDLETYRDFCYFTYGSSGFIVGFDNYRYFCVYPYPSNTNINFYYDSSTLGYRATETLKQVIVDYTDNFNVKGYTSSQPVYMTGLYVSTFNIYSDNSLSSIRFNSNISSQDILNKYSSGGSSESTDIFDSYIHNITISILGDNIPSEFDFLYMIFDFLILLDIILCVVSPFIIIMKLMRGL